MEQKREHTSNFTTMTPAILDADVNLLNDFQSTKSHVNLDTAENIQHGHHSLTPPTAEDTPDGHDSLRSSTVPFKGDTFCGNGHHFSASVIDLSKESTHQHHQAYSDISNGHHPAACATGPSTDPTDGPLQMYSDVPNGNSFTTPKKTQNHKVDLGPHASIVVQEWKLFSNTDPFIKPVPVYVDTDYLGIAKISAVSK